MKKCLYTDEDFIQAVLTSFSVRQALEKLGLNATGGNYASFHKRIKTLGVSTQHFTGSLWSKGKTIGPKVAIAEYLSNKLPITSHRLRLRLIAEGIKQHQCEICLTTEWMGVPVPLELDHINGNHEDNRLENLRILCPNCHYLTPTHRGKNWGIRSRA